LADAIRFGFGSHEEVAQHLDALLVRIGSAFDQAAPMLTANLRRVLAERVSKNVALLS
jgi:hypothetical protein